MPAEQGSSKAWRCYDDVFWYSPQDSRFVKITLHFYHTITLPCFKKEVADMDNGTISIFRPFLRHLILTLNAHSIAQLRGRQTPRGSTAGPVSV
jgi:hypothetical protein